MVFENGEETVYKIQFFLFAQRIQSQVTLKDILCCPKRET